MLADRVAPWSAKRTGLAFACNMAQHAGAIFVLACLSATRLFLGRSFQDIHYIQIVRYCATIRA